MNDLTIGTGYAPFTVRWPRPMARCAYGG